MQTFSKYNFLNSGYPNTEISTENKSNCGTITLPSFYCSICEKVNELTLNAAELGQYGAQLLSKTSEDSVNSTQRGQGLFIIIMSQELAMNGLSK